MSPGEKLCSKNDGEKSPHVINTAIQTQRAATAHLSSQQLGLLSFAFKNQLAALGNPTFSATRELRVSFDAVFTSRRSALSS